MREGIYQWKWLCLPLDFYLQRNQLNISEYSAGTSIVMVNISETAKRRSRVKKYYLFVTIIFALELLGFSNADKSKSNNVPFVYTVENGGTDCTAPPLPSISDLPVIQSLPDPFEWANGNGRIKSRDDWKCRRAEIGAEIMHYELGTKPPPPDHLYASFSPDSIMTITIVEGKDTLKLTSRVTLPKGKGPFAAIIGVGRGSGSLPDSIFTNRNIAMIQYNFGEIAPAGFTKVARGTGGFYTLYPDTKVGYFAAWAWGVSRIIDAVERLPELNIDLKHIGVTGCSFAGKIALFSGAFDERLALTIAVESGGGGYTAWRVTETLSGKRETLRNAQGAPWYYEGLHQFDSSVTKLPYDHHELMAMVAPRALFVTGNPDYEWLADESGYVCSKAAQEVWKAFGVPDRFGFSIVDKHLHCRVPDQQIPEIVAFVEKFLLGKESVNTVIATTPYQTDLSPWIKWKAPDLTQ